MPERANLYQKDVPIGLNEDISSPKNLIDGEHSCGDMHVSG